MTTRITKTWFDGEKIVTQEVPESEMYMSKDIISMAREAGARLDKHNGGFIDQSVLLRFAALVAAAEREACAKVCEEEICNCCWDEDAQAAADYLADLIRARSEK